MKIKEFEEFKKSGKIEDYLKYISKKKEVEFAEENSKIGTKRRNNSQNN